MAVLDSDRLSREDLRTLLAERHRHCVSLYLGLAQVGQETPADGIRLKNLVRDAEDRLVERGVRRPDAAAIVRPAAELIGESLRWQADGAGLALFLSEDGARRYRLAYAFEDLVIVNDRFHIEQLLPVIDHDVTFYILALSLKRLSVYQAKGRRITEIAVQNMPKDIDEAMRYDEFDVNPRWYASSGAHRHRRQMANVSYASTGPTSDVRYKEMQGYFRGVNAALYEALKLEKAPLVLIALPEEIPLYREINTYPHLLDEAVARDPMLMSEDELFARAWDVVRPHVERTQTDALARFDEYAGTGRASKEVGDIVPAAMFGRVESLFVPAGAHLWGGFDATTGEVMFVHDERGPGDEDLLDVAASHTLATRGDVFQVAPERMPERAVAAAVFRY